jgi:hypothetical protein
MSSPQECPVAEFTIVLSPAETNFVLEALAELPFKRSAPLVQKIQNACGAQIRQAEQAKRETVEAVSPEILPA